MPDDHTTKPRQGKAPAFQFYPADWLADARVAAMTLEEEGAYIRLICFCWRERSLPPELPELARLLKVSPEKMADLWTALEPCFRIGLDGRFEHRRLDAERRKQREFSRLQRDRANAGWIKRKAEANIPARSGINPAMPEPCSASASASASAEGGKGGALPPEQTLSLTPPLLTSGERPGDRFEEFWKLYPRKVGKGAARKAWTKLKPGPGLCERILEAVECQRDWPQWRKDGGQFIPHPATWLHQERWQDQGGEARGIDEKRVLPSGTMTVGDWNLVRTSLGLKPKSF